MKASCVLVLYTLIVVVNGAWWVVAIQPIVLSFGAIYSALNLDGQLFLDFDR